MINSYYRNLIKQTTIPIALEIFFNNHPDISDL